MAGIAVVLGVAMVLAAPVISIWACVSSVMKHPLQLRRWWVPEYDRSRVLLDSAKLGLVAVCCAMTAQCHYGSGLADGYWSAGGGWALLGIPAALILGLVEWKVFGSLLPWESVPSDR